MIKPEAAEILGISRLSLWKGVRSSEIRAYRAFLVKGRPPIFYGFKRKDLEGA